MRKTLAILLFLSLGGFIQSRAQSLKNSEWKFYVQGLNDTLTYHFDADTSWAASTTGDKIVRSLWKESNDTVRLNDVDGMYPCHDGEGVYRYVIEGDVMTWVMLSDPCPDRAGALNNTKFYRKK
ncbi:MAG TPA: hypothetical protein VGQ51_11780 [Puia sp.]|jgi:hypothetical protein|nr:hypothetical protein [Puia sp.]